MKGVVTGGYVLAAAGCSLYLQLLKVKEKLGAGGAEGESSGSQAEKGLFELNLLLRHTQPGKDLPLTCRKAGIFGASVTSSSFQLLALM